jgi:hypothetical protein
MPAGTPRRLAGVRRPSSRLLSFLALFGAVACSRPPEANPALAYLEVGIDPATEADTRALALARAGYLIDERLSGRTFVALSGLRRRDRASFVRVFTVRGTVFDLDVPDVRAPERRAVSVASMRPPFDLDGDPHEELAVVIETRERRCLGVLRIDDGGFSRELRLPLAELPGAPCGESIEDVAGDALPEIVARARFDELGLAESPAIPLALMGSPDGFHLLPPGLARGYYAPVRRAREEALARAGQDGELRLRLAIELAAIAYFEGRSVDEQLEDFDRAIADLDPALDPRARAIRAYVAAGFRAGRDGAGTSGLDPEPVLDAPAGV